MILDIKPFAVFDSKGFWINTETRVIPLMRVLILSETSFRKRDSDLDGIIVVVIGVGPVANETTIEPNLFDPSVTEMK